MRKELLLTLRRRVGQVPLSPGVYRLLDENGDVLYVGKAKNLRTRLRSYVSSSSDAASPWKRSLLRNMRDFDVTVTETELEALLLETNLIKELRPKYNVLMKDDKNYVYVSVSVQDAYPQVRVTRRIVPGDRAKIFGPFLRAENVRRTLDLLHDAFCHRACRHGRTKAMRGASLASDAPCLDHQIGRCNGLCAGAVSKAEYRRRIDEVVRFFRGDRSHAVFRIGELMQEASHARAFERAARLRDARAFLESKEVRQSVSFVSASDADIVGLTSRGNRTLVLLLKERGGKVVGERPVLLRGLSETTEELLAQFLSQYYVSVPDVPREILVPLLPSDTSLLQTWLRGRRGGPVTVRVPRRGRKWRLLRMAMRNAEEKLSQWLVKWEANARTQGDALKELKTALHLPRLPRRIEGYDVSHLGGTETAGSMVVMRDGKPCPSHYRSFVMRTMKEGEIDDCKALGEMLRRRLKYCSGGARDASLSSQPDLLVVDGGKGQLRVARDVIEKFRLSIPVAALAKRKEEIFIPGSSEPVKVAKDAVMLLLLMRLRDEAHRFAGRLRTRRTKRHMFSL